MGLTWSTVTQYLHHKNWLQMRGYGKKYRRKVKANKISDLAYEELKQWELPLTWHNELVQNTIVYLHTKGSRDRNWRLAVQSILQILCRRYRVPSPLKLQKLTSQGRGGRRLKSGYMDAVKVLNGVEASKPMDYVVKYCEMNGKPSWVERANKIYSLMPKLWHVGKNPRTIAAALVYFVQNGDEVTQETVADDLQVTIVSLRTQLRDFRERVKEHVLE